MENLQKLKQPMEEAAKKCRKIRYFKGLRVSKKGVGKTEKYYIIVSRASGVVIRQAIIVRFYRHRSACRIFSCKRSIRFRPTGSYGVKLFL